ncbi:F-box/kelch-repeat protein SKIP25-like [Primulina tabacum]|uniref:F-box/kelch-repeat protein SKIP25-like n=1 Tax=Primulina tabacum TaxID=48773 RepID=UPI003F59C9F1
MNIVIESHCKNKDIINENDEKLQINFLIKSGLLPGLPDHLAQLCLSTLPPSLLYSVSLSWRRLIYSPSFPPFLSLYAVLGRPTSIKYPFIKSVQLGRCQCQPNSIAFFSFDPISSTWRALPTPPTDPSMCIIRQHPSFISRILSIQSLTASGRLVLIAATTHKLLPALTHPLVFDPLSGKWYCGPPFSSPRRWCVAGSINGGIYVASGTGAQYHGEVARSMERWDISKKDVDWQWETRASFKDGRFSREAVEALGYRGKLCMVNVKGKAVKEGAVYDVVMNQWQEMPKGMLDGWNGPAAVDNDFMYVVDQENGSLSRYNEDGDCWEELIEPSELLKGAEHLSSHKGKICAVSANGGKIIVADILAKPVRVFMVNPPQGMEVISVHILPRMSVREH